MKLKCWHVPERELRPWISYRGTWKRRHADPRHGRITSQQASRRPWLQYTAAAAVVCNMCVMGGQPETEGGGGCSSSTCDISMYSDVFFVHRRHHVVVKCSRVAGSEWNGLQIILLTRQIPTLSAGDSLQFIGCSICLGWVPDFILVCDKDLGWRRRSSAKVTAIKASEINNRNAWQVVMKSRGLWSYMLVPCHHTYHVPIILRELNI